MLSQILFNSGGVRVIWNNDYKYTLKMAKYSKNVNY